MYSWHKKSLISTKDIDEQMVKIQKLSATFNIFPQLGHIYVFNEVITQSISDY